MSSPPEVEGAREQNAQFVRLAKFFGANAIPVPELLASDPEHGFYLMSDLGDQDFEAAYKTTEKTRAIAAAIDMLHRIQSLSPGDLIASYDRDRLNMELGIFDEWFIRGHLQTRIPSTLASRIDLLVDAALDQPQVCIHRDYHCRNLLWSPAHEQPLGIVDFQDALIGPVTYDLASLLYDCYFCFAESDVQHWASVYLTGSEHKMSLQDFLVTLRRTALQRMLKAIGIFVRLAERDGRPTHLPHVYSVLDRATAIANQDPDFEPLGRWLTDLPRPSFAHMP
jgi:aminoglycoside/choline kinase family phosphotransferase